MVKKKDSSYRFCVDYRKLNKVTKKDAYPIPYVSSTLDKLRDAKYISSLDIKSAFWQVPMAEKSKQFTAFTVPGRGLFQFCRMPFGLTNSPATWQRLIDRVLYGTLDNHVFVYLDDVVIVTQTFEKHLEVLAEVLTRLQKAGLVVNYNKCEFCRSELKYLGYVVGANGLQVDPDKVKSILDIPRPSSVKDVRRFIGMVAWYRRFVPSFSSLSAPITSLLKKNKRFLWTEECEESFQSIKEKLVKAPILSCPNFDIPFIVHTDASGFGIGAVLTQEQGGTEKVISYLSRSLNRCERNYSTTERECLAVVWSVEKLRPYLEGSRFIIVTDHASLVWLNNLKDPTGRLARWAVKMQQYDFDIIHRKGKEHALPDFLSRSVPFIDSIESISYTNSTDKWFRKMCEKVKLKPSEYPDWRIEQDKLLKHVRVKYPSLATEFDYWKEVVPKDGRASVLYDAHSKETSGHCGIQKSYDRLRRKFYWPGMRKDVGKYVRNCRICQAVKPDLQKPAGLMAKRQQASQPWETICIDLIGPLPKSKQGYSFILTVVDQFSKFVLLFPLRSATAKLVCKNLEDNVLLLFGAPRNIICDNGVQFRGKEFGNLCDKYGIDINFTALYHPQANPSERVNQVAKTMLRAYVSDNHRHWDIQLQKVACAIRTSQHEATKSTPYFVNFGREMSICGKDIKTYGIGKKLDILAHAKALEKLREDVRARLVKASELSSKQYNLRRRDVHYLKKDLVWKRNFVLSDASKHFAAKLAPRYVGPFSIARQVSPWTYELEDKTGKKSGIWHCSF